jgi:hypothetical protein
MNKKLIGIIVLIAFCMTSFGLIYYTYTPEGMLSTLNIKIEKSDDNTWRVRDNNGKDKGTLKVKQKDKINWQAKGSDMVFIFSKDINDYFDYEEGMFEDDRTQKIDKSKKLRVTLKPDAPKGELVYEVSVVDANATVIGNSPPRLIIQ